MPPSFQRMWDLICRLYIPEVHATCSLEFYDTGKPYPCEAIELSNRARKPSQCGVSLTDSQSNEVQRIENNRQGSL